MKYLLFLTILFIAASDFVLDAQAIRLPQKAKKLVDAKYRSWALTEIPEDIRLYFKEKRFADFGNVVTGDWNGDHRSDYAVLLRHLTDKGNRIILVLMRGDKGFSEYILSGADFLVSKKKGTTDYDWSTESKFKYQNDSISSVYWERAAESYVWNGRRFHIILISD